MDPLGVIDHLALDTQQKSFIDLAMPFELRAFALQQLEHRKVCVSLLLFLCSPIIR